MFAINHRSIVFSAAALLTVLTSAAAQEAQPPAGTSQNEPTSQSDVAPADDDDSVPVLAEPDFRVLNLPSTLRLPRHGSNFQLTHRFNGNLRRGTLGGNAGNLFGLDQGAAVGFEYRFGVARHLQAAEALGANVTGAKEADAGPILADRLTWFMERLGVPNGLKAVGYTSADIPGLVEGTLPQHRVTKLSPRPAGPDELAALFEDAMVAW